MNSPMALSKKLGSHASLMDRMPILRKAAVEWAQEMEPSERGSLKIAHAVAAWFRTG